MSDIRDRMTRFIETRDCADEGYERIGSILLSLGTIDSAGSPQAPDASEAPVAPFPVLY